MRKFRILFLIFVLILGGVFFFREDILDFYSKPSFSLPQFEKGITDFSIKEAEKQILTPPPLRAEKEVPEAFLTRAGVIQWTNIQREKYGLPPLKENKKLNTSAELKVKDMFENQYFTHYSPSGEGVRDLVERVSYEFIAIGENLALGNFKNDQILVQGWMDSPGHRENILSPNFQEIGVAVAKNIFEGRETWMAVQHFGLPLSACPQPDEKLKAEIDSDETQIEELEKTLKTLEIEIKFMKPKRGPAFEEKVEKYNSLVSEYNALVKETQILIYEYNSQIKLFNECVSGIK